TERHVRAAIADSEFAAAPPARRSRPALVTTGAIALGLVLGAALHRYWASAQALPAAVAAPQPTVPNAELDAALDRREQAEALATMEAETPAVAESMLSAAQRQRLEAYAGGGYKLLS